jgi:Glycosyl transferase family 2
MLVSIVINNYNYGRFLAAAIESALAQTYPSTEVIVVDDGSSDNSGEIAAAFGDRIRTVLKPNGGQGSAFNAGFEVCLGEIVIFLDSDDTLRHDAVSRVVTSWEPTFSKCHFPLVVIDEEGAGNGDVFPPTALASGDALTSLLESGSYCTAPTSGNAFSRAYLTSVMPVPEAEWRSHADCYLIHLAPFYGLVGVLREPLGYYRIHTSSLSLSGLVTDGRIQTARLSKELLRDLRQQELIQSHGRLLGYSVRDTVMTDRYGHYKIRLASLKASPEQHPFREDRLFATAWRFIRRVWIDPHLSFLKRVMLTVWAVALLCSPRSFCETLITQGIPSPWRLRSIRRIARPYAIRGPAADRWHANSMRKI